jgi:hypothetical protein
METINIIELTQSAEQLARSAEGTCRALHGGIEGIAQAV